MDMTVGEASNVFVERQMSSKLCGWLEMVEGGEEGGAGVTLVSSVQLSNSERPLRPFVPTYLGCWTFQEDGVRLTGLSEGSYILRLRLGKLWEDGSSESFGSSEGGTSTTAALFQVRADCGGAGGKCGEVLVRNEGLVEKLEWCEGEGTAKLFEMATNYCWDKEEKIACVDMIAGRMLGAGKMG